MSIHAEAVNRNGRTDLLVADREGKTIPIAEFKIWDGADKLAKGIDQLLQNYVSVRDQNTAIILFNKTAKDFSTIIGKASDVFKKDTRCIVMTENNKEIHYSFLFRHPIDTARSVRLELIFFNFYSIY